MAVYDCILEVRSRKGAGAALQFLMRTLHTLPAADTRHLQME